jgi:hypothetical protein
MTLLKFVITKDLTRLWTDYTRQRCTHLQHVNITLQNSPSTPSMIVQFPTGNFIFRAAAPDDGESRISRSTLPWLLPRSTKNITTAVRISWGLQTGRHGSFMRRAASRRE